MCVARAAFRDYSTVEEILAIPPPPKKERYPLYWRGILDTPFFYSSTEEIQKASLFSGRVKHLGHRAGYTQPPTIHDFRAEGLYLIGNSLPSLAVPFSIIQLTSRKDQLCLTAWRVKHGGHTAKGIFRDHYMPNNPDTDDQGSYFRGELRSIFNDLFRGITLLSNPHL